MRNLKILGLSLLALVGVMAISASAAQAKWLLLLNKVSVLKQSFNITTNLGELLVPKLGLKIHCEKGTGSAVISLNEAHTILSGEAKILFENCKDLEFNEVCKVMGVGDKDGWITAKGTGLASMDSTTKYQLSAESTEFANIQYLGEECPFLGVDGKVSGSITIEIENPLTDATSHGLKVVKQSLFYGKNPAELHNGAKPTPGPATGTAAPLGVGETSGIHLVKLVGCEPIC